MLYCIGNGNAQYLRYSHARGNKNNVSTVQCSPAPPCCFCFAIDPAPRTCHFGSRPYLVVQLHSPCSHYKRTLQVYVAHFHNLAYWTLLQNRSGDLPIHSLLPDITTTRYLLPSGIRCPWQWVFFAEIQTQCHPASWKPIQVLADNPATLKRRSTYR